ncbi:MAG: hypothetical protein ACRBDX_08675 [Gammaproteobacteria bacterium]
MAHFQERRASGDRRLHGEEDRRKNSDRRLVSNNTDNSNIIEQARFNAWLVMTDKGIKN